MPTYAIGSSFSSDDLSDWFWGVVASARRDRQALRSILSTATKDEVVRFSWEFDEAAVQLTDSPYIDNIRDESEDGIQDIADWVVSQGKEYYSRVLESPDLMPSEVEANCPSTLSGVAESVFHERFDESMPFPKRPE